MPLQLEIGCCLMWKSQRRFQQEHKPLSQQKKAVKQAMRREHNAGPESNYLFKLWREENERRV